MPKMTLHEAIARSVGNKARTCMHVGTDDEFTLIVQELGVMQFRWWVISEKQVWENSAKRQQTQEHLKNQGADPFARIWLPAESDEDAIDGEELLSFIHTAVDALGKPDGQLARSDVILRQEAQFALDHLSHILRRYRRIR